MKDKLFEKLIGLLRPKNGQKYDILDFGCGSGRLLGKIHDIVGNSSRLIGYDSAKQSIEQASNCYPDIDFVNEKFVDSFKFLDESFDCVISVDTLECIPNKFALLTEIHRILKKEGMVLFSHWDWDTQVYYSENKQVVRKFITTFSDWQQDWMDASDGQMGRSLWGIFQGSRLFRGEIDVFSLIETDYEEGKYGYDRLRDIYNLVQEGKLDQKEYGMILDEMKTLYKQGKYFYSLNSYIYVGRKA